jgi:hypothetical protein
VAQVYYDQATQSLPALHPGYQIVLGRRAGALDRMRYSLLVYRERPTDSLTTIAGVAELAGAKTAWQFEARCSESEILGGLVATLEAIARLQHSKSPVRH